MEREREKNEVVPCGQKIIFHLSIIKKKTSCIKQIKKGRMCFQEDNEQRDTQIQN